MSLILSFPIHEYHGVINVSLSLYRYSLTETVGISENGKELH